MAASKVSLKLLIDTKKHKVLFAEADKDFVDFLFNLLTLPVGTVIRLLTKQSMVGCIGNLYESVENLNATYMQPNQDKDVLLKPHAPFCATNVPLLQYEELHNSAPKVYICNHRRPFWSDDPNTSNHCHPYLSNDPKVLCPQCNRSMSTVASWVAPKVENEASGSEGGYVKGVVTYMVMDDLVVKPMSTISSITMLNKFNVTEIGALEEREVDFTMTEGLKLLKASLQSEMVLTSVFLGNSGAQEVDFYAPNLK